VTLETSIVLQAGLILLPASGDRSVLPTITCGGEHTLHLHAGPDPTFYLVAYPDHFDAGEDPTSYLLHIQTI